MVGLCVLGIGYCMLFGFDKACGGLPRSRSTPVCSANLGGVGASPPEAIVEGPCPTVYIFLIMCGGSSATRNVFGFG